MSVTSRENHHTHTAASIIYIEQVYIKGNIYYRNTNLYKRRPRYHIYRTYPLRKYTLKEDNLCELDSCRWMRI